MEVKISPEKYDELRDLGGGDNEFIKDLLAKFMENSPRLIEQAQSGLAANDPKKIEYAIHTLKGSALSLGLTSMAEFLVELNKKTKADDFSTLPDALPKLHAFMEGVKKYSESL